MNPHSRLSQFNQRAPRSGPDLQGSRFMDTQRWKPSLNEYEKTAQKTSKNASTALFAQRPIATNSRVKQDEKLKNDMHMAFINNALQEKTNGKSRAFDELVTQFDFKRNPLDNISLPPSQLRQWITSLTHVVSRLERTHAALVEVLVRMPWTILDTASVKAYTIFISMLVSARPEYLSMVLNQIAQGFTYQAGLQILDIASPESSSNPLTRRIIYERLHFLLRNILALVPTLPSTLAPLLIRYFPHKRQKQIMHTTYIRNLLKISSYCPEIADKILEIIVDRAIQIDVEIQVELEDLDNEETNGPDDPDLFELDPFDVIVGQEGEVDSDSELGEALEDQLSDISSDAGDMEDDVKVANVEIDVRHIQDMVKKLDSILSLTLEHFRRTYESIGNSRETNKLMDLPPLPPLLPGLLPSTPDPFSFDRSSSPVMPYTPPPPSAQPPPRSRSRESSEASPPLRLETPLTAILSSKLVFRSQFNTLMAIFDRTILRTFKSRYTQFLLFWYTSLDTDFSDVFQGMLVDRALFQINTPTVTRAAAASYIGSFVSRATFVDRTGARRVISVLCNFLREHLNSVAEPVGDNEENIVFYAVIQAVLLIFCFRWRDMSEDEDEVDVDVSFSEARIPKKWLKDLDVVRSSIESPLNPLRACSFNVTTQFARVALATNFMYCFNILDANKKAQSADASMTQENILRPLVSGPGVSHDLNTFFPFDPCKLPQTNLFIEEIYRDWASVAIDDEDDEDEDGGEGEGEDEDEVEETSFIQIRRPENSDDDVAGVLNRSLNAMSISQ